MSSFPQSLPAVAIAVLDGHSKARDVSENLFAAYWMHSRDNFTALYLLQQAHSDLHELATAMGYTITPIAAPAEEQVA